MPASTIEYVTPTFYAENIPVVLPEPGPLTPPIWYMPATVYGPNGTPITKMVNRGNAAGGDIATVTANANPSTLLDDGTNRVAQIRTGVNDRLENKVAYDGGLTFFAVVKAPSPNTTIVRIGRYKLHRATDGRWELSDNGAGRYLYAPGTGEWTLLTLICNAQWSKITVGTGAAVSGGNLDGAGALSNGMLGNGSNITTYELAELMVIHTAVTDSQAAEFRTAIIARHSSLLA